MDRREESSDNATDIKELLCGGLVHESVGIDAGGMLGVGQVVCLARVALVKEGLKDYERVSRGPPTDSGGNALKSSVSWFWRSIPMAQ